MAFKKSKRLRLALSMVTKETYSLDDALHFFSEYRDQCKAKFDETVEIILKLGVNTKQSDQVVRGAVPMPNGLGKQVRVAVFGPSEIHEDAKNFGAEVVGAEDLIEEVKNGRLDFDVCISVPNFMSKLAVLGKILGPKGLIPNPKLGTVTDDVKSAIQRVKSGQVSYKAEKGGIIHAGVGKLSFDLNALRENILCLYGSVLAAKPQTSKGVYMQKGYLGVSEGPSIRLDLDSLK